MNNVVEDLSKKAAYGGNNWVGRNSSLKQDIGKLWADCGICNEYSELEAVPLHTPGDELLSVSDPELFHMLETVNLEKAQTEHKNLKQAYKSLGVKVYDLKCDLLPPPNIMFLADLFFMTPEGAVLGRPASSVRSGEEVHVARTLSELKIPILKTIRGMALNVVTTGRKRILMPAGNPKTQSFYESLGIECQTIAVNELMKATGAVVCLTGILRRRK